MKVNSIVVKFGNGGRLTVDGKLTPSRFQRPENETERSQLQVDMMLYAARELIEKAAAVADSTGAKFDFDLPVAIIMIPCSG